MNKRTRMILISRLLTLTSYSILLITLFVGIITKVIYPDLLEIVLFLLLILPLLIALRGILHAKRYTHAWMSLLVPFYLILGTDLWVTGNKGYAFVISISVLSLFIGCILYSRFSELPFRTLKDNS